MSIRSYYKSESNRYLLLDFDNRHLFSIYCISDKVKCSGEKQVYPNFCVCSLILFLASSRHLSDYLNLLGLCHEIDEGQFLALN